MECICLHRLGERYSAFMDITASPGWMIITTVPFFFGIHLYLFFYLSLELVLASLVSSFFAANYTDFR
jgi:hypothetical protein